MTWFKVDDSFWGHPKRMQCTSAAIGLWVTAGSWSAQQLTDGHIPAHVLPALGKAADARQLAAAGLWEKVDGGFQFHDWKDWQPTKAQVTERRDAEAKRKQEWRDKKAARAGRPANVPAGQTPDATRDSDVTGRGTDALVLSTRPDPTRPDPTVVPTELQEVQQPRSAKPSTPDRFDEFWNVFPKRVAKTAARRRWDTLIKRGIDPADIIAGAKAYAQQVRGTEAQFIKQPDGWLNAGRWEDEPVKPAGTLGSRYQASTEW